LLPLFHLPSGPDRNLALVFLSCIFPLVMLHALPQLCSRPLARLPAYPVCSTRRAPICLDASSTPLLLSTNLRTD
jgi:hypothetical protein